MAKNDILVAKRSGVIVLDGRRYVVQAGRTHVRASHPIVAANPHMFGPITVDYDVEEATATPGRKRSLTRAEGA